MNNCPNVSIAFISENTYTQKYPLGAFIEKHLTKNHKILRYYTTEFLENPINILKENLDTFTITEWIKELPEFDILILEDAHELNEKISTQVFLGNILIELVNAGKKVIITSSEKATELQSLKNHLYSILGKDRILESDFKKEFF